MDLKEQEYILAIAKYQNITKAAEKLYISQPTLSIFLKNLEEKLGAKLFQYIDKKMIPTQVGELYIEKAKELLFIQKEFFDEVSDLIKGYSGRIRIGMHLRKTLYFIPKLLSEFEKIHPNIEVLLFEDSSLNLENLLLEGELDIILINKINHICSNIETIPIYNDKLLIGVSPEKSYEYLENNSINLEILKKNRLILQKPNQMIRQITEEFLSSIKLKPEKVFFTQNIETACQLAAEGYGICFSLQSYARFFSYSKPLLFFEVGDSIPEIKLYIAHRKNLYISSYMDDFINLIKTTFKCIQK